MTEKSFSPWLAYCDGASRGNPGPASFGVVIFSPSGDVAGEIAEAIGVDTNQAAEYRGLIRALEELSARSARRVRVFTDSQFVTRQFSGEYKVRDARMKVFLDRVRELQKDFERVEVVHIPRSSHAGNVRADKLANQALDRLKDSKGGRGIAPPARAGEESPSSMGHGAP